MKNIKKILLSTLVLFILQLGLGGCIAEVDGGGYYRGGGPWYHDGPWLDGGGWGRERRDDGPRGHVDIDIHPPGFRRH